VTVPAGPYRRLSQIPAEVWLDADGLARRIAVMTDPAAGDSGTPMWSIVELWDFGVLADITPPGPGEVVSPRDAYSEAGGLGTRAASLSVRASAGRQSVLGRVTSRSGPGAERAASEVEIGDITIRPTAQG
jgi:hypothetical protein